MFDSVFMVSYDGMQQYSSSFQRQLSKLTRALCMLRIARPQMLRIHSAASSRKGKCWLSFIAGRSC